MHGRPMQASAARRPVQKVLRGSGPYVPPFVVLTISLVPILLYNGTDPRLFDDAYYYIVIARHIVELGESSFTPGLPTNGYHPLWLLLLSAVGGVFGFSLAVVKVTEIFVVCAGLILFTRLFKLNDFVESTFCTFMLWYAIRPVALLGVETSLLFPASVLFFASLVSEDRFVARRRTLSLFLSGGFVIGTRLDAALFALPLIAVASVTARQKLGIFLGLVAMGLSYAFINRSAFGISVPVSGAVKSIGGLQINQVYLDQLALYFQHSTLDELIGLRWIVAPWLAALLALAVAIILAAITVPSRGRPSFFTVVLSAMIVGMLLYGARLIFTSSWRAWYWYGYPVMFFAVLFISQVPAPFARPGVKRIFLAIPAVVLFGCFLYQAIAKENVTSPLDDFVTLNRRFVETEGKRLDGQTVAMGDRAASFAYYYQGSVYHLEGLVNTASYLAVLKAGGDMRAHLCHANIRFLVDYEVPLDAYVTHRIDVFRPTLTSIRGPYITVFADEEVATFEDLSVFDNRASDGDHRIYVWRLDCARR